VVRDNIIYSASNDVEFGMNMASLFVP